jgi:hypothetical protein
MTRRRRVLTFPQLAILNAIGRKRTKLDRQQYAVEDTRAELAELFIQGAALGLTQNQMADASAFSQARVKQLIHGE